MADPTGFELAYEVMGSDELRKRGIWQDVSGGKSTKAEHSFFSVFQTHFANTNYQITAKPQNLSKIYVDFPYSRF